jgi:surface antigen
MLQPGQCTFWARKMAATEGWAIPDGDWGDAWMWLDSAARDGLLEATSPLLGSLAVWAKNTHGAGPLGHVAYVQAVSGALISVSEENWPEGSGPSTRVCPATDPAGFILPPGAPMTPAERLEIAQMFTKLFYLAVEHRESDEAGQAFWSEKMATSPAGGMPDVLAELADTQAEPVQDRTADYNRDHPQP